MSKTQASARASGLRICATFTDHLLFIAETNLGSAPLLLPMSAEGH